MVRTEFGQNKKHRTKQGCGAVGAAEPYVGTREIGGGRREEM
jgi:hypothetical protein